MGHGFNDRMLEALRQRPEVANAILRNNSSHLTIELRGESGEIQRVAPSNGAKERTEIGPLVSLIVSLGGDIEEVRRGHASLEDVFLEMMSNEVLEEEKR